MFFGKGQVMAEDRNRPVGTRRTVAADETGPAGSKIEAAAMRIARLLGRQIACEDFERRSAAGARST